MKQTTVVLVLCAYFGIVGMGAFFQLDGFPLTWVPMYSGYTPKAPDALRMSKVRNKKLAAKGFEVVRRNGSTDRIGVKELNIPKRNMWRLYYERAFGKGSPKYKHWRNTDAFNQRLRLLGPGRLVTEADWKRRLIESVNKTLGLEPTDPKFVVEIKAYQEVRYYTDDLILHHVKTRIARIQWVDEWKEDFAS